MSIRMDMVTLIGLLAGTLTTVAFVPQLLVTWRSKSADDLSLWLLVTFNAGIVLWLLYGFLIHSIPVIVANFVTLVLALAILVLKVKYRQ